MTTLEKLLFWKAAGGGSPLYERTIINNPATFTTDLAKPLRKLLIPFYPVQAGSGDPSPSNVRPIAGFTGIDVVRTGVNLMPSTVYQLANSNLNIVSGSSYRSIYCKIPIAGTYCISRDVISGNRFRLFATAEEPAENVTTQPIDTSHDSSKRIVFTFPEGYKYLFVYLANDDSEITSNIMLNAGESEEEFVPYSGTTIPVSWQSEAGTVYGGTLDALTGVLTVDRMMYNLKLSEMTKTAYSDRDGYQKIGIPFAHKVKNKNTQISNIAKYQWNMPNEGTIPHFFAYTPADSNTMNLYLALPTGVDGNTVFEVSAILEEPYTVQLDPVTLSTLKGENVIWTDTNSDNTIVYLSKTQGGGLGGGFGGGFGSGSDDPGDPENPDDPIDPDDPEIPEEPVTDE